MKHADEDQGEDLPVKYSEIADQLETQGDTLLAVRLYRQAVTVLMAERDTLKEKSEDLVSTNLNAGYKSHLKKMNQSISRRPMALNSLGSVPSENMIKNQLMSLADKLSSQRVKELLEIIDHLEDDLVCIPNELFLFCVKAHLLVNEEHKAHAALLKVDINDPIARKMVFELASKYLLEKKPKKALELLQRLNHKSIYENDPDQFFLMFSQLAEVRNLFGQAVEAAHCWSNLVALPPENLDLNKLLKIARLWLNNGEKKAALIVLMALSLMFGRRPMLMKLLASANEAMHNYEAAAMVYREML